MQQLPPLRFKPLFRRYVWGGRRLATELGKAIGDGADYAESWEVVDHGADQSIVADGPLAGTSLADLLAERGRDLLGRHSSEYGVGRTAPRNRFPLLFKFLDANQRLSVQVHPNDTQAARLEPPDLGKTEAWVILRADPGAVVYTGLKRGFDRHALEREVHRGTTELCLHRFEPQVGDCLFIPAGVVHALGAGLLVAEIQQSSDSTFRLFDWNRLGTDGRPRALHIDQALDVIDFERGPVGPQIPEATSRPFVERLVECENFVLDRWRWEGRQQVGGDDRCHLLVVLDGTLGVMHGEIAAQWQSGETMLLPASSGVTEIRAEKPTTLLDIYLP